MAVVHFLSVPSTLCSCTLLASSCLAAAADQPEAYLWLRGGEEGGGNREEKLRRRSAAPPL